MGRKKKKHKKEEEDSLLQQIGEKTRGWILALVAFAGILFFILAAFDKAGLAGTTMFRILTSLFGTGYYLFPAILLMFIITFFRPERNTITFVSILGGAVFFFSGLGIIELVLKNGGLVGEIISIPLITFFDIYASLVLLATLFLISLILTTNTTPSFSWILSLFRKDRGEDEERVGASEELSTVKESILETKELVTKETEYSHSESEDSHKKSAGDPLKKIFGFGGKRYVDAYSSVAENYIRPSIDLLNYDKGKPVVGDIKASANIIKRTLQNFGINVEMDEVSVGPSVTRYAFKPAQGVKLARIVGLKNDLSLALAAHPLRIEAPIPGKSLVGIELPNTSRTTVGLASLLSSDEYSSSERPLLFALGRGITGKPRFGDLSKMPHLLIAGATGSGKSVALHNIIVSLLYGNSPSSLRFIMIDPKRVELTLYNKTPHLLTPVITDPKKAILALKWATKEMERRYDILEAESVRDIASYHKNIVNPAYEKLANKQSDETKNLALPERMPYIVLAMDELADIMHSYPRELEAGIVRLAQMSRAVGIHLILSTQRPSVDVITGLIKANIPVRMAFQVASQIDSRTILDAVGAETLLGAGDMLYLSGEMSKPVRLQSAFISESEIKNIVKFLSKNADDTSSDIMFSENADQESASIFSSLKQKDSEEDDAFYEDAKEIVIHSGRASTTFLQRKFRIGYARAARLMDILEERGIVGPAAGAKPREILVKVEQPLYEEPPTIPDESEGTERPEETTNTTA